MKGETVYVLLRYWDTPDNEGIEVMGVYLNEKDAAHTMKADADTVRTYYDPDFWDEDMTWESEREIHLGAENQQRATIYFWNAVEMEAQ